MNKLKTTERQAPRIRIACILAVSALAWGLTACGKEEYVAGEKPNLVAENTGQGAENKVEQGTKQAATTGMAAIDDAAIAAQVSAELLKDPDLSAAKIDVNTVNGKVTLDGSISSTVARDRAETIAKAVSGVTSVSNQLVVTAQ